jgi:uncharacterized protein (TIGR00299 family) protein
MARIAYFDCFSGVAGDMILGALVDAGLEIGALASGLQALDLEGYALKARRVSKAGLGATQVEVALEGDRAPFENPSALIDLIGASALPETVRERSIRVVERIRDAEAAVHAKPESEVHFHEIGLVDTAVDVVGAVLGLEMLGVERVRASAVAVGRGFLECRHGTLPVPPPASVEILKTVPTVQVDVEGEIATPTGCALLATLAEGFGIRPQMTYDRVGYGAGERDLGNRPNLLRVFLGETGADEALADAVMLETNLDDASPQLLGALFARLFEAGALDVWATPCTMKKNRPGIVLSVLCPGEIRSRAEDLLFAETTTLGVRMTGVRRSVLDRRMETVETPWGTVRVKVASLPGGRLKWSPEFEDCASRAREAGIPVREVLEAASAKARARFAGEGGS